MDLLTTNISCQRCLADMNEQFDIKEFAKMFDAALASDNPGVQKALRNFMMVAAIVHAQELNEDERLAGPLETLVKKVADLENMVYKLHNDRTYKGHKDYYNNPTWVYNPNTSGTPYSTNTSTSTATEWPMTTSPTDDIFKYLKDIKIT